MANEKAARTPYTPLRLDAKLLERVERMRDKEENKLMYPVHRQDVLRKLVAMGLEVWERATARTPKE